MSASPRLKEHLTNLLNALTNLSPSRNLISQLSLLVPKSLATIEHSYPELTTQVAKEILRVFGIKFEDEVEREEKGFAEALYRHIHKNFDWLNDELIYEEWATYGQLIRKWEVRPELAMLLDRDLRVLHNPYAEWAMLVLRKISGEFTGGKAIDFLKMLLRHDSIQTYDSRKLGVSEWSNFKKEVMEELKINPAEFEELSKIFIGNSALGREELYYTGSRRYTESQAFLEHSEYHLDFVYSLTHYYSGGYYGRESVTSYTFRHKETLRELVEGR
jgi:hypothetical protein